MLITLQLLSYVHQISFAVGKVSLYVLYHSLFTLCLLSDVRQLGLHRVETVVKGELHFQRLILLTHIYHHERERRHHSEQRRIRSDIHIQRTLPFGLEHAFTVEMILVAVVHCGSTQLVLSKIEPLRESYKFLSAPVGSRHISLLRIQKEESLSRIIHAILVFRFLQDGPITRYCVVRHPHKPVIFAPCIACKRVVTPWQSLLRQSETLLCLFLPARIGIAIEQHIRNVALLQGTALLHLTQHIVKAFHRFRLVVRRKTRIAEVHQRGNGQTAQLQRQGIFLLCHRQSVIIVLHIVEEIIKIGVGIAHQQRVGTVRVSHDVNGFLEVVDGSRRVVKVAIDAARIEISLLTVSIIAVLLEVFHEVSNHLVRHRLHIVLVVNANLQQVIPHSRILRPRLHLHGDAVHHPRCRLRIGVANGPYPLHCLLHTAFSARKKRK